MVPTVVASAVLSALPDLLRRAYSLDAAADEGPGAFYRGSIAEAITAEMERSQTPGTPEGERGVMTARDLASYRPIWRRPLRGSYRGLAVSAAGPPAGGLTLLQMLNFLEGYDVGAGGWPSTESARLLVEAMAWAVADRELHVADPRFVDIPDRAAE